MIVAPTPCFFIVKAEGEAAAQLIAEVEPKVAHDIETVILISADFESDISAVNSMDRSVGHLVSISSDTSATKETYNPLYIPSDMASVDEMLVLEPRADGIRFSGMAGNPFMLKMVEVTEKDEPLITAKIEYRPFDIPSYSDIVLAAATRLN